MAFIEEHLCIRITSFRNHQSRYASGALQFGGFCWIFACAVLINSNIFLLTYTSIDVVKSWHEELKLFNFALSGFLALYLEEYFFVAHKDIPSKESRKQSSRLRRSRFFNRKSRRFFAIARGVLLRNSAIVIEAIELAALWGPICVVRTIGISKLVVFVDDHKSRPEFASRAYGSCYEIRGVRHWLWRD